MSLQLSMTSSNVYRIYITLLELILHNIKLIFPTVNAFQHTTVIRY